ncbi:hypothetical protein M5K25_021041 [Dendrobium thyrsiflorum]|uniref:Uncharacterized protein n=1 Tax=Dendrobium thyrsiflorum TaxID=117978 RepID=A0ABD0UIC9_DENTH
MDLGAKLSPKVWIFGLHGKFFQRVEYEGITHIQCPNAPQSSKQPTQQPQRRSAKMHEIQHILTSHPSILHKNSSTPSLVLDGRRLLPLPCKSQVGKLVNQPSKLLHLGMVISPTYHSSFPLRLSSCIQEDLAQGKIVSKTHFANELQHLGPITDQPRKRKHGGRDDSR